MRILALDSSAKVATVALCEDNKPISHIFLNTTLTHSQTLLVMIDQMIKNANWQQDDIELFAVSNGPGSFTGVRIGVSLIKGMAFETKIPCVGISTLLGLAYNLIGFDGIFCPVMDARNNQVYNSLFCSKDGKIIRLCEDRAISMEALLSELDRLSEKIYVLGDGAELFYNYLNGKGNNRIILTNPSVRYQNAVCVASAALNEYNTGNFVNDRQLDVRYLRLSQAEREYEQRHKSNN
jgi:tRNA threonylcarbamoyladenosine biosynthesis protein TsaB